MPKLFKYIVLLFLTFNIPNAKSAEVVFEPFEEDLKEELPMPSFTGASSLPHPVVLRQVLDNPSNTPIGKLFMLAQYFEARYPDKSLDLDFSEDVALIFPELNAAEVQKTTKYIKSAIRLYRLGKQKIKEIQEEKLTPKDPPLIVSDDQYAVIGDREYIPTNENEVAIISDFKKVVGYSSNQREIEAMEAFFQRKLAEKGNNTDFEHFRQMLSKLDWTKFTSYGVTEPSPFVGKAGIGSWVEASSFRARLISDTARIGEKDTLILGLHVDVPNHRFMLASTLSDILTKPQIEIINSENLDSFEIFTPLPVQGLSDQMISAYRGDFAFPIKIKLSEPNKPFQIETKLTFQS